MNQVFPHPAIMHLLLESATLHFRANPPIAPGEYPCPALRGLLGWMLAAHPDIEAREFLAQRFHPESPAIPSWTMWSDWSESLPPDVFSVQISCCGPTACYDLRCIVEALSRENIPLKTPHAAHAIHLLDASGFRSHVIPAPDPHFLWKGKHEPITLHCISPIFLRSGNAAIGPEEFSINGLIESIRVRFGRLSGTPVRDLPPAGRVEALSNNLTQVLLSLPIGKNRRDITPLFGTVTFRPLDPLSLGWLSIGEAIGAGGSVSFGLGAYALVHEAGLGE